jgi:hypothetical protein
MNGTVGTTRRIWNLAARLAAVVALTLLLAGAVAPAVHAADNNTSGPAMDKSKFKEGCEQGGGSYIENLDGSFQCNLKDGGTIKCTSTTGPCTYIPFTRGKTNIRGAIVNSAGVMTMLGADSQPTPTPTKTVVLTGAVQTSGLAASAP